MTDDQLSALFARLKTDCPHLTQRRVDRQIEVVRRCVLGSESREAFCTEFGISAQQFYADRQAALRRSMSLVESGRNEPRATSASRGLPTGVMLASSLHEAGESSRAGDILDKIPDEMLAGTSLLERYALEMEIDGELGRNRSHSVRARLGRLMTNVSADTLPFVQAAVEWNEARSVVQPDDGTQLKRVLERTCSRMQACEALDARASNLRARFLSAMAIAQVEAGHWENGRESIEGAVRIAAQRNDMPLALRVIIEANRAYVFAASPQTLFRASALRERALSLARTNALPRAIRVGLHLRVSDHIWRGDNTSALHDARELWELVEFSDNLPWRDIAATRVSNVYSALGRFEEAEQALATRRHEGSANGFAMQQCALLVARGLYLQALREAASIRVTWPHRSPRYRANELLYSAAAAHRLGDIKRATTDIADAVAITDVHPPALYIAQRIYALAHRITGRTNYRDAANDLQRAVEVAAVEASSVEHDGVLTPRQRQIAALAASGATNREIAARLRLSTRTVANHMAMVFSTLGVRARWQLPANL